MKKLRNVLSMVIAVMMVFSSVVVQASPEVVCTQTIVRNLSIQEITSEELLSNCKLEMVLINASINNIDLDIALISVYKSGIITFFTPFSLYDYDQIQSMQNMLHGDSDYFYGLYEELLRSPQSRPTTESPHGYRWNFSAHSSGSTTFFTNHFVTGRETYNVTVNNTGGRGLDVRVREDNRGLFGWFHADIHRFDVASGGSTTATNIAASCVDNIVYVRFNPSGGSGSTTFSGNIRGN